MSFADHVKCYGLHRRPYLGRRPHPLGSQGDNLWAIQGTIDLRNPDEAEGPIVRVGRIGA